MRIDQRQAAPDGETDDHSLEPDHAQHEEDAEDTRRCGGRQEEPLEDAGHGHEQQHQRCHQRLEKIETAQQVGQRQEGQRGAYEEQNQDDGSRDLAVDELPGLQHGGVLQVQMLVAAFRTHAESDEERRREEEQERKNDVYGVKDAFAKALFAERDALL